MQVALQDEIEVHSQIVAFFPHVHVKLRHCILSLIIM